MMAKEAALQQAATVLRVFSPFLQKKAAATLADYLNARRMPSADDPIPEKTGTLGAVLAAGVLGVALGISAGILWVKTGGEA